MSGNEPVTEVVSLPIDGCFWQPYELFMFARKHEISIDAARAILARHGANRNAADKAVKRREDTAPLHGGSRKIVSIVSA